MNLVTQFPRPITSNFFSESGTQSNTNIISEIYATLIFELSDRLKIVTRLETADENVLISA